MWETLAGVAGVIGALAGIIRWLLQEYFKKASELEDIKTAHTSRLLEDLSSTVEEHKKELRSIGVKLESNTKALVNSERQFESLTEDLRKLLISSEEKFERLESDVLRIGRDLLMLKDRAKNGKTTKTD